jgi:uncharacterized spore protein YtfJ
MGKTFEGVRLTAVKNQEEGRELIEKLLTTARPSAVYGEPVTSGNYTVITASEVTSSVAYGFGLGGYTGPVKAADKEPGLEGQSSEADGGGGGGGGGGAATGRPVAVITVGPTGVEVQPVIDPTKIALAFFTALGAMGMMWSKMRKASGG